MGQIESNPDVSDARRPSRSSARAASAMCLLVVSVTACTVTHRPHVAPAEADGAGIVATVTGEVFDPDGRPAAGASVLVAISGTIGHRADSGRKASGPIPSGPVLFGLGRFGLGAGSVA